MLTNKSLEKKSNLLGIGAAIIAALMFGISPTFAKLAYAGGSNGLTMTFTRALMALPCLFLIAKVKGISLKISRKELLPLVIVAILGNFSTTLMLYSAFGRMNVGMASVLHYIFPVIVVLIGILFFKEKSYWWKLLALMLGFTGVTSFMGKAASAEVIGVLLAIGSAISYAALLISVERTSLSTLHCVKLTFYTNIVVTIVSFVFGKLSGALSLSLTSEAWFYSMIVSLMVGTAGFSLLNYAIVRIGASSTSLISMVEPLSSVLFGFFFLHETLSLQNIIGCILILAGVAIISVFSMKEENSREVENLQI